MTTSSAGFVRFREIVRKVGGLGRHRRDELAGPPSLRVGAQHTRIGWRRGVPVADAGSDALVCSFGAGEPTVTADSIAGRFEMVEGNHPIPLESAAIG
jgi:hypothetical protein